MLILKHLKALQHVSIIIPIIFRELVVSLLKSLILKLLKFKIIKVDCGDVAAYNVVCVRGVLCGECNRYNWFYFISC